MNLSTLKTKTFWSGVVTIVGTVGAVMTGAMGLIEAAQIIVPAVMAMCVRDGIETASKA